MADSTAETSAYHHGHLRAALLAQAELSLSELGVDKLSLRGIARAVGVSHGAPARHFADKQSLLDALAVDGFRAMNAALAAAAQQGTTHRARFESVARAYVAFALEHAALLNLMYTAKHGGTAPADALAISEFGMDLSRDLIIAAQSAGELAPGDPSMLALVAFAQLHGLAVLAAGGMLGDIPTETALETATDLLWRGLHHQGDRE